MRASVVVERNPVTDHATDVLLGFKVLPLAMGALLYERTDQMLDHASPLQEFG